MGWYNSSWSKRVGITVDATHIDSDLTDFCCLIDERDLPTSFWTSVDSDGDDIVVTSSDGTTKLSRDLTEWDSTANTMTMRVKIPTLSSSSNTVLYLYYGNSGATETNDTAAYRSEIECHYPLGVNDNAGGSLECDDRTDNNVDLVSSGTMTDVDVVDGHVGKSIDFDGSNDHLFIADAENLSFGNGSSDVAFSVSFWMRADVTTPGSIVAKSHVFNGGEWYVHWANSKIYFRCVDHSSSGYIGRVPTTTLSTATWHKVTCTYDGNSSSGLKVYYNGVLKSLDTSSQTPYTAMENTAYDFKIGARDASVRFNGKVDEVFVSREELSAEHIKASYRNDTPATYTFYAVGSEELVPIIVVMPDASAIGTSESNNVIEGSEWYNTDWSHRVKVDVDYTEVDSNLTDYIMLLDERDLPSTFWDNTRTDGYDVLVTTGDGVTALDKDTSEWSDTDETFVTRVKVPYLSATSNTCLYIYYGKAAASTDLSTDTAYGSDVITHHALNGDPSDAAPQQLDRISTGFDFNCWTMDSSDLVDGQVGKGLEFDGSIEFLYGDDSDVWSFGDGSSDTPFSVSVWFYAALINPSSKYFISKTTDKTEGEWYLQNFEDDLYFRCVDDSSGDYIGVLAAASIPSTTTWYKLDFTYDGTSSSTGMKIYRDGVKLTTSDSSFGSYVAMENTTDLPRMAREGFGIFHFPGRLDDVFVRDSVFAADHIKSAYLNEKTSSTFYTVGSEESTLLITTTPASAIGDTVDPAIIEGSLSITSDASAIGDTVDPTIPSGQSIIVIATVSAVGDNPAPNIHLGDSTVFESFSDAIGDTTHPPVINGDLQIHVAVSATGRTKNPDYPGNPGWYDYAWAHRVRIDLNCDVVGADLANFEALISEDNLPAAFWPLVSDGGDIILTSVDGETQLDHDIIEFDSSAETMSMRVRIPTLSMVSDTIIYLYYENPTATDASTSDTYRTATKVYQPLWEEDDGPGNKDFLDRTSQSNDMHAWGSGGVDPAGRVDGQVGYARELPSLNDFIETDAPSGMDFSTGTVDSAFSASIWARARLGAEAMGLIGRPRPGLTDGLWVTNVSLDRYTFRLIDDDANALIEVASTVNHLLGDWHKWDFTYDGSSATSGLNVYVDGVLQSTTSNTSGAYVAMDYPNTINFRIGLSDSSQTRFFDGAIDEAVVREEETSAEYIWTSYFNEHTPALFQDVGIIENSPIVLTTPSDAIGDTLDPTILSGSLAISGRLVDAIGDTLAPDALYGSLTLLGTATAVGSVLDPTVSYGSLALVAAVSVVGDTLAPAILAGSLTITTLATAIGDTIDPTVTAGGGTTVSATVSAIGGTVDPVVLLEGSLTVSATVSAIGGTVDPEVLQSSLGLTTTEADAIGNTVDPTVLRGDLTATGTASAIGDTVDPAVAFGSITIISTTSAVGDTVGPSVLTDSLSILTTPVDAIGSSVDPIVVYGSLSFTMAADAVGDTVDPTFLVEGSAVIIGLTVSAKGDTLGPTYDVVSIGLELDNVARWIFSSVAAHFEPIANELDLLYHVEGIDERGDGVSRNDSIELRLTGPNIKASNGKYLISTEINVLLTNYMKMIEDTYSLVDWTGKFQAEMLERIPIYKLGTGVYDDGTYLGCLVPDTKFGVKAYYLGQISNVDRIRQSEVDGVYKMEVTF